MADIDRAQAIVDAAERAAATKDFAAAERLLREAIQIQEADLGADHPDLANTLNNLGVLCEMAGQPSEAEACYRRAYAIAAAALPADHPYVTTSRENLLEFCNARGKPVDLPVPRPAASAEPLEQEPIEPPPVVETAPVVAAPPVVETPPLVERAPVVETPRVFETPPPVAAPPRAAVPDRVSTGMSSRLPIVVMGFVVLLLIVVVSRRFTDGDSSARDAERPTSTVTSPQEPPATPPPSPPAAPPAVASGTDPKPSSGQARPSSRPEGDKPERGASANRGAAASRLVVETALLCRRFATRGSPDWQCDSVRGSVARGTLVFYTRIKSARPATVQHRWYRGKELHQSVSLELQANQAAGYRTYSRYTVPLAGAWRVEMRTPDGTLLHEERFDVR